jgi:hypothetical protein
MSRNIVATAPWLFAISLLVTGCGNKGSDTPTICNSLSVTETTTGFLGIRKISQGSGELGQSFRVTEETLITGISVKLKAVDSTTEVTGQLTLNLERDSGGAPNGLPLAQAVLDIDTLSTTSFTSYPFAFPSVITLAANQDYWVRMKASYGPSDTHYVAWAGNDTNPYSLGQASYLTQITSLWTALTTHDLAFQLTCKTETTSALRR